MKEYISKNLRNIGIVGHSGSGKTTLMESILYYTKAIDRFGKVNDGTTISDYDIEEKKRKTSISTSVALSEWGNIKLNLVDMPGYFDYEGEMIEGLRAVDMAMITVCGVSGVEVGTEKAWEYINDHKLPRAFFINKLDRENSNFQVALQQIKETFGISAVPIQYPIGSEENFSGVINVISRRAQIFNPKTHGMEDSDIPEELIDKVDECKQMVMEAVAETDEVLLEKYFNEGSISEKEIYQGLIKGASMGEITPIMCGSALLGIGMNTLLEDMVECFPSPIETTMYIAKGMKNNKYTQVKIDDMGPFSALVFKTIADPFVGKLSMFRVITGKAKSDTIVYNTNKNKEEKIGAMYFLKGKQQFQTREIAAGDIGAVAKLQCTTTGDTLCDRAKLIMFDTMEFPQPVFSRAIVTKAKGDEDKISNGLTKLLEEDLTFSISRSAENAQTIISGLGSTHLQVIVSKLKNKFGVEVSLEIPKIAYRETIKRTSDVQGKHKKQSGGHGQYGDVKIKFEPRIDGADDLEFIDAVVGGTVPRQYIPAVEKGLRECIRHGVLGGFPVIRLKTTLHDGSYHAVDSSEMAFKMAASLAYKKGIKESDPVLLEPIMHVEVTCPEDYMGDIITDISKKRGRILGMESVERGQKVIGEVPQSELFDYATDLRSMTGARANFRVKFERYEEVPQDGIDKIIEASKNLE
ncbi:elongation factor G [Clostridium sp. CM028]|uniref:elongation factor G n=1 Tax=Clostridium sp. CM028 TaxID=2851575 RepID=UPI001C6EA460|nr:elongation factor G [Clostridium sp. CM028]MBW9148302.1 elongation factor G [Clostridium sp. CM028]WLC60879.1 elongation factor G [Clostridium sp. CM028]